MRYITVAHTDVGLVKKINQDSLLIQQAQTEYGPVLLAVLCDGMGGLSMGEVASACVVRTFSEWFENELPLLFRYGFSRETLRESWVSLVQDVNLRIKKSSVANQVTMGTTCIALLIVEMKYYLMNIGDSRAYLISDNVFQLTKDQTYVQREMDANRMTYEQALVDPRRHSLLTCIGAGASTLPDFYFGNTYPNQCFLICCDGFWHQPTPGEIFQCFNARAVTDAKSMKENLIYLTELNKQRKETDNITAALIKITD